MVRFEINDYAKIKDRGIILERKMGISSEKRWYFETCGREVSSEIRDKGIRS